MYKNVKLKPLISLGYMTADVLLNRPRWRDSGKSYRNIKWYDG